MNIDFATIATSPGVYIFKTSQERIIYVGKAKNLRNRLKSYFQKNTSLDRRKQKMVQMIKDFSYIVTDNELEALILEASLIKQHKPRFNVVLRDDKNFPYLKLTTSEKWPTITVCRRTANDGNLYFGPYVPAQAMWETLDVIRKHFSIRTCKKDMSKPSRPCIRYQMNKCLGPCSGLVSHEEYMSLVNDVRLFIAGKNTELIQSLRQKMLAYSENLEFEKAARLRDKITLLQKAFESQKVIAPELADADVIGCYSDATLEHAVVCVIFIRKGVMLGAKHYLISSETYSSVSELLYSFITAFYSKDILPPPLVLTASLPLNHIQLADWLKSRLGQKVQIVSPQRGKKHDIVAMANNNALSYYQSKMLKIHAMPSELGKLLRVHTQIHAIGAFDISNLYGTEAVGAFVYYKDGEFVKDFYRRLKIRTVTGIDDYAMMKELIMRILDDFEGDMPDVVMIDGGKQHLDVALSAFAELGLDTPVVSIAKKPDRIFFPDGTFTDISGSDKASLTLRQIRDEAHRFAISYHRNLRDKRLMHSPLEAISGIGKKRHLQLLRAFGSLEGIRNATIEEIAGLKGFNEELAKKIKQALLKGDQSA